MQDLFAIAIALVGIAIPLLGSAMIPNGIQRWAAALFAVIGLFVFFSYISAPSPSAFAVGLGIGFILATVKLTTGLRWL